MCESDSCILQCLNELNLTYQRLIGFVAHSTSFHSASFSLCHTPKTYVDFLRSDLNFYCGLYDHVTIRFTSNLARNTTLSEMCSYPVLRQQL
jgi:hypothetical protein